jgi:hypothetical protein
MPTSAHYHVVDTTYNIQQDNHDDGSNATVALLNGVDVGTGVDQRSGRLILTRQLMLRWSMTYDAVDTPTACNYCIWIIRDSQTQSTLPALTDFLATTSCESFLDIDNTRRFKVLYRYYGAMGPDNPSVQVSVPNHGEFIKNMKDKVRFDDNGALIGDFSDGAYYLCYMVHYLNKGNQTAGQGIRLRAQCRIRYQDL